MGLLVRGMSPKRYHYRLDYKMNIIGPQSSQRPDTNGQVKPRAEDVESIFH